MLEIIYLIGIILNAIVFFRSHFLYWKTGNIKYAMDMVISLALILFAVICLRLL